MFITKLFIKSNKQSFPFIEREREILVLQDNLKKSLAKNRQFVKELQELKLCEVELSRTSIQQKEEEKKLEKTICTLYQVPFACGSST